MGRLIDADKLLEETRRDRDYAEKNGFLDMYYERQALIDRIKAQPTSYDPDKILDQLWDASFERLGFDTGMGGELVVNMDDVIEIVKAGGNADLLIDRAKSKSGERIPYDGKWK